MTDVEQELANYSQQTNDVNFFQEYKMLKTALHEYINSINNANLQDDVKNTPAYKFIWEHFKN